MPQSADHTSQGQRVWILIGREFSNWIYFMTNSLCLHWKHWVQRYFFFYICLQKRPCICFFVLSNLSGHYTREIEVLATYRASHGWLYTDDAQIRSNEKCIREIFFPSSAKITFPSDDNVNPNRWWFVALGRHGDLRQSTKGQKSLCAGAIFWYNRTAHASS